MSSSFLNSYFSKQNTNKQKINSEYEYVEAYDSLQKSSKDSDGDGMPDDWEKAHSEPLSLAARFSRVAPRF